MDLNYFKKTRILDAGMGQELLARGLITKGTLWSATSLIDEKFNSLVVDTHLSSIRAGADVILTNTFTTRRVRMVQNQVGDLFQFANQKACELAIKARELSKKNILIAGSLPAQNDTYQADKRDQNIIEKDFFDQASIINGYIDFFYLDVLSSGREVEIALNIIDKLDKIGADGVTTMLSSELELSATTIDKILNLATIKGSGEIVINQIKDLDVKSDLLHEGLNELKFVMHQLEKYKNGTFLVDMSIARGLAYYTGTVYESRFTLSLIHI